MHSQYKTDKLCEICSTHDAITVCEGCGKRLCKKCRSIEIYGSKDLEVTVKSFCQSCGNDPGINMNMGCKKVLALGDITDMVNQDHAKTGRFKIKLKI